MKSYYPDMSTTKENWFVAKHSHVERNPPQHRSARHRHNVNKGHAICEKYAETERLSYCLRNRVMLPLPASIRLSPTYSSIESWVRLSLLCDDPKGLDAYVQFLLQTIEKNPGPCVFEGCICPAEKVHVHGKVVFVCTRCTMHLKSVKRGSVGGFTGYHPTDKTFAMSSDVLPVLEPIVPATACVVEPAVEVVVSTPPPKAVVSPPVAAPSAPVVEKVEPEVVPEKVRPFWTLRRRLLFSGIISLLPFPIWYCLTTQFGVEILVFAFSFVVFVHNGYQYYRGFGKSLPVIKLGETKTEPVSALCGHVLTDYDSEQLLRRLDPDLVFSSVTYEIVKYAGDRRLCSVRNVSEVKEPMQVCHIVGRRFEKRRNSFQLFCLMVAVICLCFMGYHIGVCWAIYVNLPEQQAVVRESVSTPYPYPQDIGELGVVYVPQSNYSLDLYHPSPVDVLVISPVGGFLSANFDHVVWILGMFLFQIVFFWLSVPSKPRYLDPEPQCCISYIPHLASCVAAEYDRGTNPEALRQTVRQRMRRVASLPICDKDYLVLIHGTEIVVEYLVEKSPFFGKRPP